MGRRQFGSVRRLPSGRWQASYTHRGHRHIAPLTFLTKADANAFLSSVETEIRRGQWLDPVGAKVVFSEWAAQWAATIVDLRPSTRARDLGYFERYILPRFGVTELGAIDHMAVRAWIADLAETGLAPATIVKGAQIMGKIMRAAVQAGLIASSPCDGMRLPRIERREMRFLDPGEVMSLANSIDPRYRAAVFLAAYGGLRAGELFGLRAKRVDLLRRTVDVSEIVVDVGGHLYVGPPKTSAGRRVVALPRVTSEPLADHLKANARRPEDFVFTDPEGGPVHLNAWRRRFWAPAVYAAGLAPLRPHDLRHTAVALWIAAGANPKEVATRAGHTSVSFTLDRYGHLFPGSDQRLSDALDALAADSDSVRSSTGSDTSEALRGRTLRARIAHEQDAADTAQQSETALTSGNNSGRNRTRTCGLSRVKAAL